MAITASVVYEWFLIKFSINFHEILSPRKTSGSSFGANQDASVTSLPSTLISPLSHSAVKPSISERGKGQGWLPKYLMFFTFILVSSYTSRLTHSSRFSPGSTNPASTLNLPGGKLTPCPISNLPSFSKSIPNKNRIYRLYRVPR